ncbi:GNAT family N-acetyltransferase [Pedobacter sp. L105]|uniref:GNAT family N-acetyltransferase n=1 Tax=Pedobacter sp. L105 TaxID=1641871 RepID=UPI00131B9AD0|nr:GNAT family N-acetyltransferase [Pedobacter sp. L105]
MKNIVDAVTYHEERLSAENIGDLITLHAAVYRRILPLDFFQRKYDTAYTGVSYIGFIAYNDRQPIAFYGVIPCLMSCNKRVTLSAQSADTMTHPDYRKKGLFVKLAEQTFELCRETGIHIIFGFPNQNSLPGFVQQLNWQINETMDCFIIPVKTIPLERISVKFPVLKAWYSGYQQRVLKKYATHQQADISSVLSDGYDGLLRNTRYLDYKKYTNTQLIVICGAVFWIKINNGLLIGDANVRADNFAQAMPALIKLAGRLGLKQIQFHTSSGTKLHTLFAARYPSIPSFPVIVKILGGSLPVDQIKFTFADIDIF